MIRDYLGYVASRFYGRPATSTEVDAAPAAEPAADLAVFLLARDGDKVTGCVGLRLLDPRIAELTKLFVYPAARGHGGGSRLLSAAERTARELGAVVMRLNTRSDLVEAKALYTAHEYVEVEPYTNGPYVDHCFEKSLRRSDVCRARSRL